MEEAVLPSISRLHNRPDTFVIAYAVGDGVALGRIDEDGSEDGVSKIVPIDTKRNRSRADLLIRLSG